MIITRTPLRISFLGGGTDFPDFFRREGGAVLSATIDKYVYIMVNAKFGGTIRASYSRTENVNSVGELQHELIRESLKLMGITGGIEIVSVSDIPSGGGLGSSSAFTVGLLNALYHHTNFPVGAKWLAGDACEVEIDSCGKPIGKQDQYAVAYGGLNLITFAFSVRDQVFVTPAEVSDMTPCLLQKRLLLLYTGLDRDAEEILTQQSQNTKENLTLLRALADLSREGRSALESGRLDDFGDLLHRGWMLKRDLASGITTPTIDRWYKAARHHGAIGGKVLGAGGGGFMLLYARPEYHKDILDALPELVHVPFSFTDKGSEVIYADQS